LIIITHDEEFLRELGGSDYADFYYRVTKDRDGSSAITRMAMTGEEMYQFDE
jgi:DNA repair protein RAD50